jgi:hypothetical protein
VYRQGARAARMTFGVDCTPNWELLERTTLEFQSGYRAEWARLTNAASTTTIREDTTDA